MVSKVATKVATILRRYRIVEDDQKEPKRCKDQRQWDQKIYGQNWNTGCAGE